MKIQNCFCTVQYVNFGFCSLFDISPHSVLINLNSLIKTPPLAKPMRYALVCFINYAVYTCSQTLKHYQYQLGILIILFIVTMSIYNRYIIMYIYICTHAVSLVGYLGYNMVCLHACSIWWCLCHLLIITRFEGRS